MAKEKKFALLAEEIKDLIGTRMGCIATDKITVDGMKVGYMYRDEPYDKFPDTGWRLFSGTETQDYVDDSDNSSMYKLNTIANYDPAIIPYLQMPIGTKLERVEGTDEFVEVDG